MSYMLVRHTVADYDTWKPIFDEHGPTRQTNGSRGGQLLRNADNPSELLILFEVEDLELARRFAQSDELRQTMQRAGVTGQPEVFFLEQIEVFPM